MKRIPANVMAVAWSRLTLGAQLLRLRRPLLLDALRTLGLDGERFVIDEKRFRIDLRPAGTMARGAGPADGAR